MDFSEQKDESKFPPLYMKGYSSWKHHYDESGSNLRAAHAFTINNVNGYAGQQVEWNICKECNKWFYLQ